MQHTTAQLMLAYATGSIVTIKGITGHIQGISNESGSAPNTVPCHLLVNLVTLDGREVKQVYVRTIG